MDESTLIAVLASIKPPYVLAMGSFARRTADGTWRTDPESLRRSLEQAGTALFVADHRVEIVGVESVYEAFNDPHFIPWQMNNLDQMLDVLSYPPDWGYKQAGCTVFIRNPLPLICEEPYTFMKVLDIFHTSAQTAAEHGFPLKLLLDIANHNLSGTGPKR